MNARLTAEQVGLLRSSWALVEPQSDRVAGLLYQNLFRQAPHLQALFKHDLQRQGQMLVTLLAGVVAALDRLEPMMPVLRELAIRHVAWGVKAAHYDSVGAALLLTLSQSLGQHFSPPVLQAWAAAWALLAGVMKEAAYPVVGAAGEG